MNIFEEMSYWNHSFILSENYSKFHHQDSQNSLQNEILKLLSLQLE